MKIKTYTDTIKKLKTAILTSRYRAASLANRELLTLYFNVGNLISEKTKQEKWGAKVIEQISDDLQKELPGLRGFSSTNLKNMRTFFDFWTAQFPISQLTTDQLQQPKKSVKSGVSTNSISQLSTDQLQKNGKKQQPKNPAASISQLSTDLLAFFANSDFLNHFTSVGFTHHTLIITHAKNDRRSQFLC